MSQEKVVVGLVGEAGMDIMQNNSDHKNGNKRISSIKRRGGPRTMLEPQRSEVGASNFEKSVICHELVAQNKLEDLLRQSLSCCELLCDKLTVIAMITRSLHSGKIDRHSTESCLHSMSQPKRRTDWLVLFGNNIHEMLTSTRRSKCIKKLWCKRKSG